MRLNLAEVGDGGCQRELLLETEWLAEVLSGEQTKEFRALSDQRLSVQIQRLSLEWLLHSSFNLHLQTECASCLCTFDTNVPVSFSLTLKPKPPALQPMPAEQELAPEDLEEFFYEGDVIELGEILREQIILALPMFPRCKEDCRGLCPDCGTDLNQGECGCDRSDQDPRWATLRTLAKH